MDYSNIKGTLLQLLKAPQAPPDPPAGSPGSAQVFRATEGFLKLRLILVLSFNALMLLGTIVALVVFTVIKNGAPGVVVAAFIALLLICTLGLAYFLVRLDYEMRYYIVTDRSLRIRQGVLLIDEVTLTFANIQKLTVRQGPIERWFGFANLVVHTAGGSGGAAGQQQQQTGFLAHRGVLRGIANAKELRDTIATLLREYRDAGLGDPEDRRAMPVVGPTGSSTLSPAFIAALREVRDAARSLRPRLD